MQHKSYKKHFAFGVIIAALAAMVVAPFLIVTRKASAVSTSIVISQVYGGGGNGGSTYKNDFIELFNRGSVAASVNGWSVQYASSAGTTWQVTNLTNVTIQPGQYYLVQEAQGAGGTTNLPTPDVTGTIAMSATAAKVALVNTTTALTGACPSATIVDFIGYGTANCFEGAATAALTNTTAALRNNNGCTDTDSNSGDFTLGAPSPRNTASLFNVCGGAGAPTITNASPLPNGTVGVSYSVTFAASGGSGTGYTFLQTGGTLPPGLTLTGGVLSGMPTTTTGSPFSFTIQVTDSLAATGSKVFQLTVNAPSSCAAPTPVPQSCGVERWSVKTGTDADVGLINLNSATPTTIAALHALPSPDPTPANNRVAPGETTQWVIQGTLIEYKLESDSDYHVVIQDGAGNTMVTEIPYPGNTPSCVTGASPLFAGITSARCEMDSSSLPQATTSFQFANVPVRIVGVGMFDFPHGQTGASPNQMEIHPILDIAFPTTTNAATGTGANVNVQLADVSLKFGNVSGGGTTTSTPIDPSSAGPALANYSLVGPAFNLSTTATSTGPYNICVSVPYITNASSFSTLKLLHNESGVLVDRTTGIDTVNKKVCGNSPSLSPFVVATGPGPTSADGSVSGHIFDTEGNAIEGVTIRLNGTQNRMTITDAAGNYAFDNVETNCFYTIVPARANYGFNPESRSFSALGRHIDAAFNGIYTDERANPLDTTEYFVRQQYRDFLGREPEEAGLSGWVSTINNCASGDLRCDRVHVSESFFRSDEFQQRGYYLYRFYSTALGRKPDYNEFAPDLAGVSGFLNNDQLAAAKAAFVNNFTVRPEFMTRYDALSNSAYVDALIRTAGVNLGERQTLIDGLNTGMQTRAQVLRQIVESSEVYQKYYNQAFVVMEYFGYLQRDPDALYLNWIVTLDANPADSRRMVEGFVDAAEYRARFSR